jgi:predicted Zn finger-like uncharacterized protein
MATTRKLVCPSCEAGLRVADTLPVGKKIRCPKCESLFTVPGDEPDDDDNDREEEPERRAPRKRRPKRKKEASKVPLVIGLVLAGVLVLGGGGAALAVVFWPKKAEQKAEGNPPPPPNRNPMVPPNQGGQPPQQGQPTETPAGPGTAVSTAPGQYGAGRKVYEAQNCARCHSIGDEGGGGGGPGGGRPGRGGRKRDLAKVGSTHTVDWITDHIKNPKTHNPGSRMPAYDGKIQPDDLRALSEYLAGLK